MMAFHKPAANRDVGSEDIQDTGTKRPRGRPRGSYKNGVPMTPLNFYVTEAQYRVLNKIAHERRKSMGDILRHMIDDLIPFENRPVITEPVFDSFGKIKGHRLVSPIPPVEKDK